MCRNNLTTPVEKKKRTKEPKIKEEPQEEVETGEKVKKRPKKRRGDTTELNLVEENSRKEEEMSVSKKEDEETKESDPFENHAQKLIEDVHNDESLLANLKHLMEREDLNEIIMSLDFVSLF